MQDREQGRAVDADAEHPATQRRIMDVQHGAAGMGGLAMQPIDPRATGQQAAVEAERAQHGEAGRLDHEARADRLRLGKPLEQDHAMAEPVQQQGSSQPRRAAARDGDVPGRADGYLPLPVPLLRIVRIARGRKAAPPGSGGR